MMTFPPMPTEVTSHPTLYYQRPSGAATFVASDASANLYDLSGPALSDPSTGAMTAGSYLPQLPQGNIKPSVILVLGLLLLTVWLESGRKAALI